MSANEPTPADIRTKPDSKYRMILIAAARSKQIQKGATPRHTSTTAHKPTRIAIEEIHRGLVPFEILPPREMPGGLHHEDGLI
jgi:DNA-directed RNA polymerase subunit omega